MRNETIHTNHAMPDLSDQVRSILDMVAKEIAEDGLPGLQDKSMSGWPQGVRGSGMGEPGKACGGSINVIPSNSTHGVCCPTLLAISAGTRGRGGLGQVLRQIRSHLIKCTNPGSGYATKSAILVFDKDDRRLFWENRLDWETQNIVNQVQFVKAYWDGHKLAVVP
jgi:hypothetical protein